MPKKEVKKVESSKCKKKENIIVFSSHSDDFVIGAGGTIANYTKKGKKVIAVVFSYGESSHVWLKEKVVQKMRSEEAFAAGKLLKCKVVFYDLKEGRFMEEYKDKKLEKKLLPMLKRMQPAKIFTHCSEDPHPDHRVVHKITLELYEKLEHKPEVYIYSVWNPVSFKTQYPSFYVDISKTFFTKLKALKKFHSQKVHVAYPLILLIYRSIKDGFKIRKRFGEHFFRIK